MLYRFLALWPQTRLMLSEYVTQAGGHAKAMRDSLSSVTAGTQL